MSTRDASSGSPLGGRSPGGPPPPSDLELMLWLDGEIDPARAAEIADAVRRDPRARAVIAALRMAAEEVSAEALQQADAADADQIADNVMEAIEAAGSRHLIVPIQRPPAWRAPVAVALGVALAAAAAWTLVFPHELTSVAHETSVNADPNSGEPEESSATVSIDVVDFGARPGTIFYVPSEDESVLPVVWLTEDDTPSTEDTR